MTDSCDRSSFTKPHYPIRREIKNETQFIQTAKIDSPELGLIDSILIDKRACKLS